jgi:hypothetical protein
LVFSVLPNRGLWPLQGDDGLPDRSVTMPVTHRRRLSCRKKQSNNRACTLTLSNAWSTRHTKLCNPPYFLRAAQPLLINGKTSTPPDGGRQKKKWLPTADAFSAHQPQRRARL